MNWTSWNRTTATLTTRNQGTRCIRRRWSHVAADVVLGIVNKFYWRFIYLLAAAAMARMAMAGGGVSYGAVLSPQTMLRSTARLSLHFLSDQISNENLLRFSALFTTLMEGYQFLLHLLQVCGGIAVGRALDFIISPWLTSRSNLIECQSITSSFLPLAMLGLTPLVYQFFSVSPSSSTWFDK